MLFNCLVPLAIIVPPLGNGLVIGGLRLLLVPMPKIDLGKLFFPPQVQSIDYTRRNTTPPHDLRYYVSDDDYWIAKIANGRTLRLCRDSEAHPWTSTNLEDLERELNMRSRLPRITSQREMQMQMLVNCKDLLLAYQAGEF